MVTYGEGVDREGDVASGARVAARRGGLSSRAGKEGRHRCSVAAFCSTVEHSPVRVPGTSNILRFLTTSGTRLASLRGNLEVKGNELAEHIGEAELAFDLNVGSCST